MLSKLCIYSIQANQIVWTPCLNVIIQKVGLCMRMKQVLFFNSDVSVFVFLWLCLC